MVLSLNNDRQSRDALALPVSGVRKMVGLLRPRSAGLS